MTEVFQSDILRAQSELLEASLSEIPDEERKQRRGITRRLSQVFFELVNRLAPPLVLEIGAHEGTFSATMKNSRPKSRVIAFEANPLIYERYAPAMKQAGVEYLQLCVADRVGEMTLKVPAHHGREKHGKGSILTHKKAADFVDYRVGAVTLDGFLGDAADSPSAMWVDVEGALAHILAGAERTLRNCVAIHLEMETMALWEGQIIDTDVVSRLEVCGLTPVLRDIQHPRQYNAIFLRSAAP